MKSSLSLNCDCVLFFFALDVEILLPCLYKVIIAGPAAKVRPVRPWPYRFLREKKWRRLDSNLRVRYRVASPSSSL